MSRVPNETRRARISEIREKLEEEIHTLEAKLDEYANTAFKFQQEAKQHYEAGRIEKAKDALRMKRQYNRLGDMTTNRISRLFDRLMKLDTTNHKLFMRSFPPEYRRGIENIDPTVNTDRNYLERVLIRRYGLTPYNNAPVASNGDNNDNNNNSNVQESQGCLRDAFGRCIEGLRARFTRKNKNKKNGGGKKRKGKSMKRVRRN